MPQFIKLHPHYLMLVRDRPDTFAGKLSFSVEQYGLIVHDFVFDLQLTPPNEHYAHWRFICEDPAQLNVPNFVLFLKSIEHYIFMTLKFSPVEAVEAAAAAQKRHQENFVSQARAVSSVFQRHVF
jgi:hypothetical protein